MNLSDYLIQPPAAKVARRSALPKVQAAYKIAVICDPPTQEELHVGEPLVGSAGRMFYVMLSKAAYSATPYLSPMWTMKICNKSLTPLILT